METERLLQNENKEDELIVSKKPDCPKLLNFCNLKALCNQACLVQSIGRDFPAPFHLVCAPFH